MYEPLYEDANFFIIDKKPGIAVHSGAKIKSNLIDLLNQEKNKNTPSNSSNKNIKSFYLLHRIDKETSGVLVLSKRPVTRSLLSQFSLMKKTYWAVVKGKFSKKKKIIDLPLQVKEKYQISQSKMVVKKEFSDFSLLEIELFTGRFHQIRKQLKELEHPILGDKKYGDFTFNKKKKLSNLYLFSKSIELNQKGKKPIKARATLPKHFSDLFSKYNIQFE